MTTSVPPRSRLRAFAIALALGPIAAASLWLTGAEPIKLFRPTPEAKASPVSHESPASLCAEWPDAVVLTPGAVERLGIQTALVEVAKQPERIILPGSLALDPNRLTRVRVRFPGEVIAVGQVRDQETDGPRVGQTVFRQLQVGDRVEKGDLLAVVWSKDLGEKKSDLVDALLQLRLDQRRLEKFEEGYQRQSLPEASVRQARRDVEGSLNAVARAERTLRVWRLSETEITAIKQEAEEIRKRQGKRDSAREKAWAEVEMRAPFAGLVLERNLAVGDLVDPATDLYKVADVSRLSVWAHALENQLPELLRQAQPVPWTVRLKANAEAPPLPGRIDMIGQIVDPVQHTVLVRGSVDNADGRLRAGQFITAVVEVPPAPGQFVVPIAALVEDGRDSVVLTQPDPSRPCYRLRRVRVTRRAQETALCQAVPGGPVPGDRVVTGGALAIKASLDELQNAARRTVSLR